VYVSTPFGIAFLTHGIARVVRLISQGVRPAKLLRVLRRLGAVFG
jgi:hypothetical protein